MSYDNECNIRNVAKAIVEVTASTRVLGTELQLTPTQLNDIESYTANVREQKVRLIETWFKNEPNPTWEKLVAVLRSPLVEEHNIAEQIEQQYIVPRRDFLISSLTESDISSPPQSPFSLSSISSLSSTSSFSWNKDEKVNTILRKNVVAIKHHFSQFLLKIKNHLTNNITDVDKFKTFLSVCYKDLPAELNLENLNDIFQYFVNNGYWDYMHFDFLSQAVDSLADATLKTAEEEYQKKISGYIATVKISEFIAQERDKLKSHQANRQIERSTARKRSGLQYRDKLSVKLDVNVETKTLKYIEDLWKKLSYLQLPKIGVILDCIIDKCIWVVWIILSPSISEKFEGRAKTSEAVEFFKENKIVQVYLNQECLYIAEGEDNTELFKRIVRQSSSIDSIEEEPGEYDPEYHQLPEYESDHQTQAEQSEFIKESSSDSAEKSSLEDYTIPLEEKTIGLEHKSEVAAQEKESEKVETISEKLLAACRSKTPDMNEIRGYLEQEECDVNIRENDDFRWSPLMWACENNHFEIGRLLLRYQPQVNIQDKKEWTPLVLASRAGDLEIVQGIVALGAEIDKPTNKLWTPLMWAAQEGHSEVAEFLLQQGALVDSPDENGWTPLMQASQEGHVDVINVLLDHNANANHQTNTTWCALMAAAKNMHSEAVDALLKRGAKVDLARDDGSTALQVASYYRGNSAVVNALIKHKAQVDHQNKDGMTALMLAINKGHLDMVQALIERGADLNKQHPETGWTAIFFAVKSGNLDIFKELLYKGAKTEIEGANVADVASEFEQNDIVSELKVFKEAPHRQISSHEPTLEQTPSTLVEHESSTVPVTSSFTKKIPAPKPPTTVDVKPVTTESATKPPVVEKETESKSSKHTKDLSKSKEESEAKKASKTDITRKGEIIDLLMRGFGSRLANPNRNISQYADKGLPSAGKITHDSGSKFILPPSPAQRPVPIQQSYTKVEPADDLYS